MLYAGGIVSYPIGRCCCYRKSQAGHFFEKFTRFFTSFVRRPKFQTLKASTKLRTSTKRDATRALGRHSTRLDGGGVAIRA